MKNQHHENILRLIKEYSEKLKADPLSINDREMFIISDEFYKRDWNPDEKGHSMEGLAFQRGIVIGMQLYRQIANINQPEYAKL